VSYAAGATIPAGGCSILVNVTSASGAGSPYTNTIAVGALASSAGSNGAAATAKLFVNPPQPPSISKSFSPNRIGVGGISVLTISLGNGNGTAAILTASLVDTLPTNMVIAATPGIVGTCALGNVTAAAGGSTITYASGAIIPVGGCSIAVNVTSSVVNAAPGYTNTIPVNGLQTSVGNNNVKAEDTLYVLALPAVIKTFAPSTVLSGSTSTLTISLTNVNPSAITLTSSLTDNLPAGMVVATPNGLASTCTTGSVTAIAGSAVVSYASGASIPSGGCTIIVNMNSASGVYTNTIAAGALKTSGGNNPASASATLTVLGAPTIAKSFSVASIIPGGTAVLTISLGNSNASALTLTSALTDTLPAGMTVAATPGIGGTCPGTVTATTGAGAVVYGNGGVVPVFGCTISVNVTATALGLLTNTIPVGALVTTGGSNPTAATASLAVAVPITGIPTLSDWGLITLAGLMALFGMGQVARIRRR
jgi:hypothetical protein